MVSLVFSYMARPHWRDSPWNRYAFHRIIWLRSKLNHGSLSFRQFSVLHHRWPLGLPFFSTLSLVLRTELVPRNLKQSIVERLLDLDHGHRAAAAAGGSPAYLAPPLTNGKAALQRNFLFDKLSWACRSDSVSEVFLTWHIATCILETQADEAVAAAAAARRTAARLSKYCAYLVAFRPELLPDCPDKTERVVDDMKAELGGIFWCWEYYLLSHRAQAKKIMQAAAAEPAGSDHHVNGVVRNGAKLGSSLVGVADAWKLCWRMCGRSSSSSWRRRATRSASRGTRVLVQGAGGEFITVLWALTTHIGVSSHGANKLRQKL